MVSVCNASELPRADTSKVYLLRTFGSAAHEIWDLTDRRSRSRSRIA
jgi:hypothetical protein